MRRPGHRAAGQPKGGDMRKQAVALSVFVAALTSVITSAFWAEVTPANAGNHNIYKVVTGINYKGVVGGSVTASPETSSMALPPVPQGPAGTSSRADTSSPGSTELPTAPSRRTPRARPTGRSSSRTPNSQAAASRLSRSPTASNRSTPRFRSRPDRRGPSRRSRPLTRSACTAARRGWVLQCKAHPHSDLQPEERCSS